MELPYLQITDEKEVTIYLWMKGLLTMLANIKALAMWKTRTWVRPTRQTLLNKDIAHTSMNTEYRKS